MIHEHLDSFKIWAINIGSLALTATNLEMGLKILLLMSSLGYTLHKWLVMAGDKKKGK